MVRTLPQVYYWSEGNYEVDFIVELKGQIIAIEVKSERSRKSASMDKFKLKYPHCKTVFLTSQNYLKFEKNPRQFILDFAI